MTRNRVLKFSTRLLSLSSPTPVLLQSRPVLCP